jgi:hypothetical protein
LYFISSSSVASFSPSSILHLLLHFSLFS